jgi:glucose-6-phosphate isomerase
MTLQQSIQGATAGKTGPEGVDDKALAAAIARCEGALDWLRARHADGALPLLRLPETTSDLAGIKAHAARIAKGRTNVVILGTGGSSLGGQTLTQLAGHAVPGLGDVGKGPRLHFMDNLDPDTYTELLDTLPLSTTHFIAISKSGGTGETLMQTAAALSAIKAAGLEARTGELVTGLSEPLKGGKPNGLRALLAPYNVPMLDHDPNVGGRYSVLTNVGLLPAAILGLDIAAVRAGAADALAPVLAKKSAADVPPAVGAALGVTLAAHRSKKNVAVVMAYADRLERFAHWYVQLWGESLGKDGKGTTPLGALGPVDQHSQVQLFIGGPRDKFFTVITTDVAGRGPCIDAELAKRCGEPDFAGKSIGDMMGAEGRATADTLVKNGCPVRTLHLDRRLDAHGMGELLMHFMLETIITGHLMGVDAFDQPAVEEGKVLAKKYLMES